MLKTIEFIKYSLPFNFLTAILMDLDFCFRRCPDQTVAE